MSEDDRGAVGAAGTPVTAQQARDHALLIKSCMDACLRSMSVLAEGLEHSPSWSVPGQVGRMERNAAPERPDVLVRQLVQSAQVVDLYVREQAAAAGAVQQQQQQLYDPKQQASGVAAEVQLLRGELAHKRQLVQTHSMKLRAWLNAFRGHRTRNDRVAATMAETGGEDMGDMGDMDMDNA